MWIEALKYEFNRLKYVRVQTLMNIWIAKAYRMTSSEALCIVTGITPFTIKSEEAAKHYLLERKQNALRRSTYAWNSTFGRTLQTSSTSQKPTDTTNKLSRSSQTGAGATAGSEPELQYSSETN